MNMSQAWKNQTIYQIFIDRFADYDDTKDAMQPDWVGGTIRGVTSKVNYLKELGVNTILLTPFSQSSAYHGYHTTDLKKVDPHFGDLEDVKELVGLLHDNEMRIIVDYVPNHISAQHHYFLDAQKNKNSTYADWFFFKEWPDEYTMFLGFPDLVKLNLDSPDAREYVIENASWWVKELGLDGLRLDHAIGPSFDFWSAFSTRLRQKHPDLLLIGEVYTEGTTYKLRKETCGMKGNARLMLPRQFDSWNSDKSMQEYLAYFDGFLDVTFTILSNEYLAGRLTFDSLQKKLTKHYARFDDTTLLFSMIDNHDRERALFVADQDIEKVKAVVELQMSLPHPALIYYGSECGMTHDKPFSSISEYADLLARQKMIWNPEERNQDLYSFYQKTLANRQA